MHEFFAGDLAGVAAGGHEQGTVGDATGSRPGMMDFKGRAKFDAWTGRKGMTKDKAMEAYVALVDRLTSA